MRNYFDYQQKGEQADIYIFGDIVAQEWADSDTSGYGLVQQLRKAGNLAEINVHVDSYGGEVSEGWAIYNTLRGSGAKVNTFADGFVASAAIYPFLAGQQRTASQMSAFYFHPVSGCAFGYADDLRAEADSFDQMTETGLAAFTAAGVSEQEARALIQSKAWYTPAQMLDKGIATAIARAPADAAAQQSARREIMQRIFASGIPPEAKKQQEKPSLLRLFAGI